MTVTSWIALAVVAVTVWALIKRYETRLVLITAGLFLACISFTPMQALNAFAKSMTNSGLIMAICSAMGFALVIQMTKCDVHLVKLLSAPLSKLGFVLIPAATAITYFICVAIPSAAGCAAAVGPTLIPIMLRAGISKEGTAAAILAGTFGSMLSPGLSHNPFVAKMAGIGVMDVIGLHMPYTLVCGVISLVGVSIVCFALGDYKKGRTEEAQTAVCDDIGRCNILKAIAPLIPVALLVTGNLWLPAIKMGVAQAMLIGAIYTLAVTLANPQEFSKKFFVGMGKGYGDVLGSKIPLFMSLAAGMTHEQRKQQANLAAIYSFAVMFVSLIGGNLILSFFGISFGAMRIAGGFVIAIIGTQMLFGGQGPNNAPAVQRGKEDYSFFPLAMPGIAGPGTIAVVIGYSTKIAEAPELTSMAETFFLTTLAILVTSIIAWVTLRSSEYCASRMGPSGMAVFSKLIGFFLICIGVQFMGSGARAFIAGG